MNVVSEWNTTMLELEADMEEIEVWVGFDPAMNATDPKQTRWCDDLFVYIDYGPGTVAPVRRKSHSSRISDDPEFESHLGSLSLFS